MWTSTPAKPGWYVVWQRGRGVDVLFWGGEDDPVFELFNETEALYFGPFRIPFVV
jgi:hypothetical protein